MMLPGLARFRLGSLAAAVLAAGLLASAGCQRSEPPHGAAPKAESSSPATAAVAPEPATVALDKLKGRWLRPDGGYVLAIGEIDADGRAEVRYYNPSPINVAWARAKAEGNRVTIDVELRDTNYPGCLYKLEYRPAEDRLVGTYFQAQMQQTHEILFIREP